MKISVNDKELFTLTDMQKRVMAHVIPDDIFEEDMKRRLQWILTHKYEHTMDLLRKEWEPKLREAGVAMIPTDNDRLANLIFSQPDYRNRSERDSQAQNS